MVKRHEDIDVLVLKDFRGGEGEIRIKSMVTNEEIYNKGRLFGHTVINPGCSVGYHQHVGDCEGYYIIKGKGEFNDNGTLIEVGVGDYMHTPDGEWHGIKCLGDEPLELMAIVIFNN